MVNVMSQILLALKMPITQITCDVAHCPVCITRSIIQAGDSVECKAWDRTFGHGICFPICFVCILLLVLFFLLNASVHVPSTCATHPVEATEKRMLSEHFLTDNSPLSKLQVASCCYMSSDKYKC